ncbi:MAG: hypothetical protein QXX08_08195 [Candidatus Bathyarchaeia archaeon]
MKQLIDVAEEKDPKLKPRLVEIANKHKAVLLTLIAPYVGRQLTPTKILSAHIGLSEEFAIETVIDEIKAKFDEKTLLLLVNSPGGLVQSSYKVARALRKAFKKIIVFVPHIAASGGTLVALTGNQIVMGMMSQLTPLDPQKEDENGKTISASAVIDAHIFVTNFFKDKTVDDAPYTYRVLAEKFDPIDIRDAIAECSLMEEYICEILEGSGYNPNRRQAVAEKLVRNFKTHGDVINIDRAKEIGLNVVPDSKYPEEWKVFREWLGCYMLKSADKHIIRFVFSENLKGCNNNDKSGEIK